MMKFVPIFPLSVVAFPGEELNLHIFKQKYRQLIQDCSDENKEFGIPVVIDNKMQELGTIMTIRKIAKKYENGDLDVVTEGQNVFRILEPVHHIPGKLYKGAIVHFLENKNNGRDSLMNKVLLSMRILHQSLNVNKDFKKDDKDLISFDIAHHVGLTPEQEYELLGYQEELHRQEYLRRHLNKSTPILSQIEQIKERVRMNGHFRWLK